MTHRISQYLLILVNASILVLSQLMLKQGMKQGDAVSLSSLPELLKLVLFVVTTPKILIGLSLSVVSMLLWLTTLSRFELSFALPMLSGLYYILALLASLLFLSEPLNAWRWGGTALITLGVILLAKGG